MKSLYAELIKYDPEHYDFQLNSKNSKEMVLCSRTQLYLKYEIESNELKQISYNSIGSRLFLVYLDILFNQMINKDLNTIKNIIVNQDIENELFKKIIETPEIRMNRKKITTKLLNVLCQH